MSDVKVNRRKVTPEMAKKLLAMNTANHPLSPRHVEFLRDAMKNGEWKFCGDAIRIAEDGVLLDGQHRLHAIVASGCTVEMLLVEGLPRETFNVIDTGKKGRGAADVLAISGEKNSNVLAAALMLVHGYERNDDMTIRGRAVSIATLQDVLARHPDIRKYANPKQNLYRLTTPGLAVALSYLFSLVDAKAAEQFMERLCTGVGLEQNNPILQLRELLTLNLSTRTPYTKSTMAGLIIKAFNLWRVGKTVNKLRFGNDEKFPVINGMPAYVREREQT